jgi:hypothetical protein
VDVCLNHRKEILRLSSRRTSSRVAQQPFLLLVSASSDIVEWHFRAEVVADPSWTVQVCDGLSTEGGIDTALSAWSSGIVVPGLYVRQCLHTVRVVALAAILTLRVAVWRVCGLAVRWERRGTACWS